MGRGQAGVRGLSFSSPSQPLLASKLSSSHTFGYGTGSCCENGYLAGSTQERLYLAHNRHSVCIFLPVLPFAQAVPGADHQVGARAIHLEQRLPGYIAWMVHRLCPQIHQQLCDLCLVIGAHRPFDYDFYSHRALLVRVVYEKVAFWNAPSLLACS